MCAKTDVKPSVGQISISDSNHPLASHLQTPTQLPAAPGDEVGPGPGARTVKVSAHRALSDTCVGLRGKPPGSKDASPLAGNDKKVGELSELRGEEEKFTGNSEAPEIWAQKRMLVKAVRGWDLSPKVKEHIGYGTSP